MIKASTKSKIIHDWYINSKEFKKIQANKKEIGEKLNNDWLEYLMSPAVSKFYKKCKSRGELWRINFVKDDKNLTKREHTLSFDFVTGITNHYREGELSKAMGKPYNLVEIQMPVPDNPWLTPFKFQLQVILFDLDWKYVKNKKIKKEISEAITEQIDNTLKLYYKINYLVKVLDLDISLEDIKTYYAELWKY